jgi:membrane-associated PAP2 superfamily phosphatase
MTNKQHLAWTLIILFITIVFFGISSLDIIIQDTFFNRDTHTWILDKSLQPYKFIFYDGIKKVLILIGFLFLILLLFFRKKTLVIKYKQGIFTVVLSAILIPLVIGGLKKYTNMPCPKDEIHYGGTYPKTAVWERYSALYTDKSHIKCWPAGHASGGFALMSLFFLFKRKRNKLIALGVSLVVGWSMGFYKMLIGDHFFSHTIITMILAWLIILIIHFSIEILSKTKSSTHV